jgi:hypothetical protein
MLPGLRANSCVDGFCGDEAPLAAEYRGGTFSSRERCVLSAPLPTSRIASGDRAGHITPLFLQSHLVLRVTSQQLLNYRICPAGGNGFRHPTCRRQARMGAKVSVLDARRLPHRGGAHRFTHRRWSPAPASHGHMECGIHPTTRFGYWCKALRVPEHPRRPPLQVTSNQAIRECLAGPRAPL